MEGMAWQQPARRGTAAPALPCSIHRQNSKLKLLEENRTDSRKQALSLHKSLINISSNSPPATPNMEWVQMQTTRSAPILFTRQQRTSGAILLTSDLSWTSLTVNLKHKLCSISNWSSSSAVLPKPALQKGELAQLWASKQTGLIGSEGTFKAAELASWKQSGTSSQQWYEKCPTGHPFWKIKNLEWFVWRC